LVKGCTPPYGGDQYSEFTGNQWNENWEYDMTKIKKFTNEQLWNFYITSTEQAKSRLIPEPLEPTNIGFSKKY
jgi:hypothetical protein